MSTAAGYGSIAVGAVVVARARAPRQDLDMIDPGACSMSRRSPLPLDGRPGPRRRIRTCMKGLALLVMVVANPVAGRADSAPIQNEGGTSSPLRWTVEESGTRVDLLG